MEKLEHPLWIVQAVNRLLGPVVAPILAAIGHPVAPGRDAIPDFLAISLLIVLAFLALGLFLRSRLSVDHPGKLQIVIEDLVLALAGLLDDWIGPKGRQFLPIVGALGGFILVGNYIGLVPGFMAPTSNMNVTAGCAVTIWVYYHVQGLRAQGPVAYFKHFVVPPGTPIFLAPLMLIIEPISHISRILSLTLRLFGNIFGEEMIIAVLMTLIPWIIPVPIMALALITGALQAFIFVMLSVIYLQGAVAVDHGDDQAHEPASGRAPAAAAVAA